MQPWPPSPKNRRLLLFYPKSTRNYFVLGRCARCLKFPGRDTTIVREGYHIGKTRVERLIQELEIGWLWATIMDLYSRRIIGWSLRDRLDKRLVIAALNMALKGHNLLARLILHSDRGSQYISELYQPFLVAKVTA